MSTDLLKSTITVGIPTLNSENRLPEALDSVLAQTHRDYKVCISNNASIDGTAAICEEYSKKYSNISFITQPKKLSMRANFRHLLDNADTEHFCWLADDDIWNKEWLETTNQALLSDPKIKLAFTDCTHLRNDDEVSTERKYDLSDNPVTRLEQLFLDKRYQVWMNIAMYGLWRTDYLRDAHDKIDEFYDQEGYWGTDHLFRFHVEINSCYKFIHQRLFTKREFSNQRSYVFESNYGRRYELSKTMATESLSYFKDAINSSGYSDVQQMKMLKVAERIALKTVTQASFFRMLKWRLFPWYNK